MNLDEFKLCYYNVRHLANGEWEEECKSCPVCKYEETKDCDDKTIVELICDDKIIKLFQLIDKSGDGKLAASELENWVDFLTTCRTRPPRFDF